MGVDLFAKWAVGASGGNGGLVHPTPPSASRHCCKLTSSPLPGPVAAEKLGNPVLRLEVLSFRFCSEVLSHKASLC